jgi:energy-converting hydrogenase Eha subunit A
VAALTTSLRVRAILELPTKAGQLRSSAIMRIRNFIPPLLAAGASAVAITVAPLADATPTCTSSGRASVCASTGNAQVTATPPPVNYQAQYPFFGNALIFHHGGRH